MTAQIIILILEIIILILVAFVFIMTSLTIYKRVFSKTPEVQKDPVDLTKYRIVIETFDGQVLYSDVFETIQKQFTYTAIKRVHDHLHKSFDRGYFLIKNVAIPTRTVKSATIEKVVEG